MTAAGGTRTLGDVRRLLRDLATAETAEHAAALVLGRLGTGVGAAAAAVWAVDRRGALVCAGTWVASGRFEPFERWCRTAGPALDEGPLAAAVVMPAEDWTTVPADAGGDRARADAFAACGFAGSLVVSLAPSSPALGALELVPEAGQVLSPAEAEVVRSVATALGQRLELLAARSRVAESDRLRQAIFDAALDAFVAIDGDGCITVFSPSAEQMFGWSRAEAIGQPVAELIVPPAFRPFHEEGFARYRTTGVGRLIGQRTRLSAVRRDGTQFPIELAVVPVDLPGDTAFAAFVRDLSTDTDIEEALVESGQRFAEQARALQRSFLPASIPTIDGLDLAVRYRSGGDDIEVGGDFYDVFQTTSGAWALAIGDVQGKGLEAAAVMALARFTIRGIATRRSRVGAVLPALNEVLLAQVPNRPCTLVYGRLTPHGDGFELRFGLAGHPPPLHVSGGTVRFVGRPGLLLGVTAAADVVEQRLELAVGDVLVLYTDGLTEARRADGEFLGERRVAEAVERWHHLDAASIAQELEQLALTFQDSTARDDIALVVLKVTSGSGH